MVAGSEREPALESWFSFRISQEHELSLKTWRSGNWDTRAVVELKFHIFECPCFCFPHGWSNFFSQASCSPGRGFGLLNQAKLQRRLHQRLGFATIRDL